MPDITGLMLGTAVPIIVLTIVAIVVVMFVVRRFTGPDKQLLATGETAQATVVQIWDTGVTINDNPRIGLLLEVQPANRPAYQVKTTQTVSRLQTSMYQPGQTLEVKIDPANPKKIAITAVINGGAPATAGMASAAQAAQIQQTLLATEQMCQAVRSMGVPAQAAVLAVTDMGVRVGDAASMMKVSVQVQPADRPAFKAETQGAIADTSRPKYQPGSTVWVKFNPNDLTQVALDHA
jgi:hypothetical protein